MGDTHHGHTMSRLLDAKHSNSSRGSSTLNCCFTGAVFLVVALSFFRLGYHCTSPSPMMRSFVWLAGKVEDLPSGAVPGSRAVNREWLASVFDSLTPSDKSRFKTSIPMYYINLDKDHDKRAYMETTYGRAGKLTRVPSVNGRNLTEVFATGFEEEMTGTPGECCDRMAKRRVTPATVALTFSHFKAIKTAYDNGDEYAITFEDDASDMLVPYWQLTLEELVDRANYEIPGWKMLRLMYSISEEKHLHMQKWEENSTIFSNGTHPVTWGCVAQLFSRDGLETIVQHFWDEEHQKWHCPEVCVADHLVPDFLQSTYIVQPPMFTVQITEGNRGVRNSSHTRGDNRWVHLKSIVFSLQWNIEAFQIRSSRLPQLNVPRSRWYPEGIEDDVADKIPDLTVSTKF